MVLVHLQVQTCMIEVEEVGEVKEEYADRVAVTKEGDKQGGEMCERCFGVTPILNGGG